MKSRVSHRLPHVFFMLWALFFLSGNVTTQQSSRFLSTPDVSITFNKACRYKMINQLAAYLVLRVLLAAPRSETGLEFVSTSEN